MLIKIDSHLPQGTGASLIKKLKINEIDSLACHLRKSLNEKIIIIITTPHLLTFARRKDHFDLQTNYHL